MYSMTKWVDIITNLLDSERSATKIRNMIHDNCLLSPRKQWNTYQVDGDKVWNIVIMTDKGCVGRLQELGIYDVIRLYSYCEEIDYQRMRGTFPKNRHKKFG